MEFSESYVELETCFMVGGIISAHDVDEIIVNRTKMHSDILQEWWVEHCQERRDVPNRLLVAEFSVDRKGRQLLPSQPV